MGRATLSESTQSTTRDLEVEVLGRNIAAGVRDLEKELVALHRLALTIVGKFGDVTSTVGFFFAASSEGGESKRKGGVCGVVEWLHAATHELVSTVAAALTRLGFRSVNESFSVRFADVDRGVDWSLFAFPNAKKKGKKGSEGQVSALFRVLIGTTLQPRVLILWARCSPEAQL